MGQSLVSKEVIRQIKERIDITEVVSSYVALTRTGQNSKGLCPFHAEKTPSFTVSPSRQVFHCFGCHAGGDVFAFLMKRENLSFGEALRELGQRAGVAISWEPSGQVSEHEVRKEIIVKINASATAWFRHNLLDAQIGKDARAYLTSRGITDETAEAFGLGFAPASWDGLNRALRKEGFSAADLGSAGLAVAKEQASRRPPDDSAFYDRFRGRIMFPIHDLRGRVIAFGGRVLGDGLPKYLNSPDTPVFRKGSTLYGLARARQAAGQANSSVVVEGYFDAVALSQGGVTNVVATLGTALTPDHVRTLGRFARRVVLLFDPDPAGVRAAIRTLDLFKDTGIGVRVVSLPQGDDPDTFVRREGPDAFRELEARAPSLIEFAVDRSLEQAATGAMEDRIRSVDEVLMVLQSTDNRIEKEECLRLVAERLGISQQVLIQRYPELVKRTAPSKPTTSVKAQRLKGHPEERGLVWFLLHGKLSSDHVRALHEDAFTIPAYRRIVECSLRHVDQAGHVLVQDVLDELVGDAECGDVATELSLSDEHHDDVESYIRDCLAALGRKQEQHTLSALIAKLRVAERDGRVEEVSRLNAEVNALRLKKAVGGPRAV